MSNLRTIRSINDQQSNLSLSRQDSKAIQLYTYSPRPTNFSDPLTSKGTTHVQLALFPALRTQRDSCRTPPPTTLTEIQLIWQGATWPVAEQRAVTDGPTDHAPFGRAPAICSTETNNLPRVPASVVAKGTKPKAHHYLRVCMFSPNYPNKFKPAIIEREVADFSP